MKARVGQCVASDRNSFEGDNMAMKARMEQCVASDRNSFEEDNR